MTCILYTRFTWTTRRTDNVKSSILIIASINISITDWLSLKIFKLTEPPTKCCTFWYFFSNLSSLGIKWIKKSIFCKFFDTAINKDKQKLYVYIPFVTKEEMTNTNSTFFGSLKILYFWYYFIKQFIFFFFAHGILI